MTPNTEALFKRLAEEAPHWNNSPLFDGTKEERGNLTDLKKLGLVTTDVEEGNIWINFTDEGVALAKSMGMEWWD